VVQRSQAGAERFVVEWPALRFIYPLQHQQWRIVTRSENLRYRYRVGSAQPLETSGLGVEEVRRRVGVSLGEYGSRVVEFNPVRRSNIATAERLAGCDRAAGDFGYCGTYAGMSVHGIALSTRGSPGSPSTRSPRMLRMMSLVPPSMVLACERRKNLE